jgi:hypothetical protein
MIVLVIAALMMTAIPLKADAASSAVTTLQEGQSYSSALTGAAAHEIRFTNEDLANVPADISSRFTVYIDGEAKLIYYGSEPDFGQVVLFKVNAKTTLLFVSIKTEDEVSVADKIYRYSGGTLSEVGDLNKLTKPAYQATIFKANELTLGKAKVNKKGAYLSDWTRSPVIKSAGKNKFTVNWRSSEDSVGIYYVNIPYTYKGKKVNRTSKTTFAVTFEGSWKTGTVKKTIKLYTKPGGKTLSFTAKKSGKLKITKVKLLKGNRYFKAEYNSDYKGWFNGAKGGFYEAKFAG